MTDSQPTPVPSSRRYQFTRWDLAEVMIGGGVLMALMAEHREESVPIVLGAILTLTATLAYWHVRRETYRGVVDLLWVMLAAVLCFYCLRPMTSGSPTRAGRAQCEAHLRQITQALRAYHDQWDRLPPAVTRDAVGRPLHSWRTLILPYLGRQAAYDAYNFSQPWDSPWNRGVARQAALDVAQCPSAATPANVVAPTNYFLVLGPGRTNQRDELPTLNEFQDGDGADNTILVVESDTLVADWFEPRDLTIDEALRGINPAAGPGISGQHEQRLSPARNRGIVHVAFADKRVRFLPDTLDRDTLRTMLSIDGGETIDWSRLKAPDRRFAAAWPVALTVLYVAWVIIRHWPRRKVAHA